ncbi:L-alanine exporter AlaE [Shigella flexneri]
MIGHRQAISLCENADGNGMPVAFISINVHYAFVERRSHVLTAVTLRHAVADTFAMVVYCSVVNMCIEVFLSGMSFNSLFIPELVAIPVNIV